MDSFYNAFMSFLDLLNFVYLDFQLMDRNRSGFFRNILILWLQKD